MVIHDIEQNTPEWEQLRIGKFTASSCAELLMKPSDKGYKGLIKRIAYERIFNERPEFWQGNKYTERGHELEAEAISSYEFEENVKIERVGFVELDDWTGCSPDGFIKDKELIQVKCPKYTTHIDYLIKCDVPGDYKKQMQFEMMVTSREANIFYSYHPKLRNLIIVCNRDEEMITQIKEKLEIAKQDVINLMGKLK